MQKLACPRTSHIEQMPLRGVDLVEIALVAHALDAGLQRDDLVVAGNDRHSAELQALREVHGGDRCLPGHRLQFFVQHDEGQPRALQRLFGAIQFSGAANEHADFMRGQSALGLSPEPVADTFEADVKLRSTIKSALTYPVVVLIMAIVSVIGTLGAGPLNTDTVPLRDSVLPSTSAISSPSSRSACARI